MIDKVFLITGGEAHKDALFFLRDHKYNFAVLDDNPECFLKKKYNLSKVQKLSFLQKKNLIILFYGLHVVIMEHT